ncbi:MAG TPA: hypothetical protein VKF81_03800 [Blastocatellia bacterium]|nr:hypothetical protein [Blastocatellia bacterium]
MAIRTVVFLSNLKPRCEQQLVHDLPIEFPSQAISKIDGIKGVTICHGNGLFAAVVDYEGDFEKIYKDYISSPSVQAFHFKVARFFDNPPQFADLSRLPIAGDVFYWDGQKFQAASG